LIFWISISEAFAQKKSLRAEKVKSESIRVDGIPDEAIWLKAETASNFTEWEPTPGQKPKDKTIAKIVYDERAIYLLGIMYTGENSKVSTELTERDDAGTTDNFEMLFDPFGDDDLGFCFGVTAAGVQFDFKLQENGDDYSWNAVWKSRVNITDSAWIAEIEIPYSALRFPKDAAKKRKINIIRFFSQGRRQVSWNPVDPTQSNFNLNNGYLENFEISDAPIRLSLSPYVSAYAEKQAGHDKSSYYLKGGADLKYGINESFTLDMMLIPDFGQVRSDDESLNLSPYEIYYSEKRSFFREGTELFDKAGIFYSRRIGGTPRNYFSAYQEAGNNEIVSNNPSDLQLLNATKLSGKTKKGSSIGILNALSLKSEALILDTVTNTERKFTTQNFTNYNVTAFQQSLKNNSYISFINTNMLIPKSDFSANVSGADFKFAEKSKTYALFGTAAYSRNTYTNDSVNDGYFYELSFRKIQGNFKFEAQRELKNDSYNPNYMGYLQRNNVIENEADLSYTLYNPSEKWLRISPSVFIGHEMNYLPKHLQALYAGFNVYTLTHQHTSIWINGAMELTDSYNFDETRNPNRYIRRKPARDFSIGFSTDYSKTFALDINTGLWYNSDGEQNGYHINFSPRFKPTDYLLIVARTDFNSGQSYGYAYTDEANIVFGMRLRDDIQNTLDTKLIFNSKSSLNLRVSHIRSTVDYAGSFLLDDEGHMQAADFELSPIEYNMLNAYILYQMEFAPGSFLSLAWQNNIIASEEAIYDSYFSALSENFRNNPNNSISLKVLFYIDYFTTKNKLKKL
jgi:hypothetical protein